jgi:hypothetical protein
LPKETGEYINALVAYALEHLSNFSEAIAEMVAGVYAQSPGGERFVLDPTRCNEITRSTLFLDEDGNLVTVKNPELVRKGDTEGSLGYLIMDSYQSYEVLTGALAGRRFDAHSRPLPSEPIYRPGVILGNAAAALPSASSATTVPASGGQDVLRVFLCHASEDKDAVWLLHRKLQDSGFRPWLDKEDLVPGQDWDMEITKAVRAAHVILVCLSPRFEKRGYLQKEVKRALDVADEQPDGTIFLIPVRLEECNVPERLKRWQWVDLFNPDGYPRLEVALKIASEKVST